MHCSDESRVLTAHKPIQKKMLISVLDGFCIVSCLFFTVVYKVLTQFPQNNVAEK